MLNNLNILFVLLTFISSLISISSVNWLGVWMGLEFNMISFIPLIIEYKNILPNESALKYFIIQASASSLFLFSCLLQSIKYSFFWNFNMSMLMSTIIVISISLKLGAAPFQSWFILVISGLNWYKSLLLMTWQKLAPLFILNYMFVKNNLIFVIAMLSALVGALGGLTQTFLKKILAFSSINHLGWMMMIIYFNSEFLKFYFSIYMFMTFFCVKLFNDNYMYKLNQQFYTFESLILSFSLLSLGGLPPFLGFFPKWIVINQLMMNQFYLNSLMLVFLALITLFFYLQISLNSIMFNFIVNKFYLNIKKTNFVVLVMMVLTMSGLMLSNLLYT